LKSKYLHFCQINILYFFSSSNGLIVRVADLLHFKADPDPALLQNDGNLLPQVYRPSRAPF
jgi:hypothetical protein